MKFITKNSGLSTNNFILLYGLANLVNANWLIQIIQPHQSGTARQNCTAAIAKFIVCYEFSRIVCCKFSMLSISIPEHSDANKMTARSPKLHLWIPALFQSKGGIQVYSAFLLAALQAVAANSQREVFLKHDEFSEALLHQSNTRFRCFGRYPTWLRTSAFAFDLLRSGCVQRPDLIITTHVNFAVIAAALKQWRGVPYWVVAHGIDVWNPQGGVPQGHRSLRQIALRRADRILAVSGYTRDRLLREQALDPRRVVLLPNTFDADRFKIAPKPDYLLRRYQLAVNQPVILTVARLESIDRQKGYDQILQALPQIRRQIRNVRYLLVGTGGDRVRIEQMIDRLQLRSSVTLTGFVPEAELGDHYNLCDLFAMPSQQEGFGIVYLEALACGKPTVGGDCDGAIDALANGELGVLVDPTDIPTIACTLTQILQGSYVHPLLYQPEMLRQQAIDRFGFAQFQRQLAELLLEVNWPDSVAW